MSISVGLDYNQPLYFFNGIIYNPEFFNSSNLGISKAFADSTYLRRTGIALSVATFTSFQGSVTTYGLLTCEGGVTLSGGLTIDNLTVNGTSSFIGQSTFTLPPNLPAGYEFLTTGIQTISGSKTFLSVLASSGINDTLSISSPIITGSNVVNAPYFNATNPAGTTYLYGTSIGANLNPTSTTTFNAFHPTTTLGNNILTNTTQYATVGYVNSSSSNILASNNTWTGLNTFQSTISTPILSTSNISNSSASLPITISNAGTTSIPTSIDTIRALRIGWNGFQPGQGATDLINCAQGGDGGFSFSATNATFPSRQLASMYTGGGLRLYPNCAGFRIDDTNSGAFNLNISQLGNTAYFNSSGISTTFSYACGNVSGILTNALLVSTNAVSPQVNFSPLSTSTFNSSIPTTTLTPSTANQFATVSYVTSSIPTSLLGLDNTWTGLNNYNQRIQMTIKTDPATTCIGTGAGGNLSTLATGSGNTFYGSSAGIVSTLCNNETVIGTNSGVMTAGNQSYNTVLGSDSRYLGNNNTILGASSGNFSTTVSYSDSTCVGIGTLMTASNQITIGRATETVRIQGILTTTGSTNINNTIMNGTAVVNNDLQINGNTIRPLTISSAAAPITYVGYIPPYIIFIPAAGMSFTLPAPSAANTGQEFVIRKYSTGGGQTIIFNCTGNLPVWVFLNAGPTGSNTLAVTTVWQLRFVSTGALFLQIA